MKALILNSGMGTRMGVITKEHPKCMTDLISGETIISRQLNICKDNGITDIVITTGYFDKVLVDYCQSLGLDLNYEFCYNPLYNSTNYIYSIYCAKEQLYGHDIILMHGDLVFTDAVFKSVLESKTSCMTVSSTTELPEKDFKAVIKDNRICKVGIEFFDDALAAQPLYKLNNKDFGIWLDRIVEFCESGTRKCYAENAFNEVSDRCEIYPLDVKDMLCNEVDTEEDLMAVINKMRAL